MSSKDYFADLIDTSPICRTITYNGKRRDFYFRRLNSGERFNLSKNLKYKPTDKGDYTTEIDLGDWYQRKMTLLHFSLVDESGKRVFKNTSDVQELEAGLFELLYKEAEDVNKEDTNEGKS